MGKRKIQLEDKAKTGADQVTLIEVVLDESGSMWEIVGDTLGGLNGYIGDQKKQADGGLARFSLTKFSSMGPEYVRNVVNNVPIDQVKPITEEDYRPSGGTPLLDAVGQRITEVDTLLNDYKVRPAVLFVVITDGFENTSSKFKKEEISKLIAGRDGKGWTFTFLGASEDAWEESQQYGVSRGNTMTVTEVGGLPTMDAAFSGLSAATTRYRTAGAASTRGFYTAGEENPDFTPTSTPEIDDVVKKVKKTTRPSARGKKGFTSKK